MKKLFFPLIFLAILTACGKSQSPCEQYLGEPGIRENYRQIECLDDTSLYYTKNFPMGYLFLGFIRDGKVVTRQEITTGPALFGERQVLIANIKPLWERFFRPSDSDRFDRVREYYSSDSLYPAFKALAMEIGLEADSTFEREFWRNKALVREFMAMSTRHPICYATELFKKNSNQIYLQLSHLYRGDMDIYALDGTYHRTLYTFIHENESGRDIRGLFAKEYKATDSSFYAKYESGDWILYDEKRDTVEFHIEDTAGVYLVEYYKTNGDTIHFHKGKRASKMARDNIDQGDVMRYYHYLPMNIY